MVRKDDDDAGAAIGGGIIGAFVGYGIAKPKIQSLEAQNRTLQDENQMLRSDLAQLQEENRKLKEELQKKGSSSAKNIVKSLFDKI